MDDFDKLKAFLTVFTNDIEAKSINYDGHKISFTITENDRKSYNITLFREIFSKVDILLKNRIEVVLSSLILKKTFIYWGIEDFFNGFEKWQENFNKQLILVLQETGKPILKNKEEVFSVEKSIIFNYYVYRKILNYFKQNLLFTTLTNETNNEFIIVSKNNGVYHIGYKYREKRVKNLEDLEPVYQELTLLFEKKEFIQFFKEIVTNSGVHLKDKNDRFFEIIQNLKMLLNLAEKDYENYVLDFGFEKIKSKFKEERNKYFESLEKNIETVNKQVFAFPLTFSAAAFASYQVKDKFWILGLILTAYVFYTIIAFYILHMVSYNIKCLDQDVNKEENEIKNTYNKLYSDFQDDFKKIWTKISKLKTLIIILKIILSSLLILFIIYSLIQIAKPAIEINNQKLQVHIQKFEVYSQKKCDSIELTKTKIEENKDSLITKSKYRTNSKRNVK
ncbi:hypothetical protein [Flavobacterium sp. I3-2]|uniref:hypothetical protein n=1 Tax=Flavobacterium sp. I3-2 TaxID=2748319 RepID=UPI0015AA18C6|nr:hypothetical protein [Flavobacterium sp. I3-2]